MSGSAIQAALYARVSSERQAAAQTIQSQLAALCERVARDGLDLPAERMFIDEGYSGATLIRPALERLRDVAAVGGLDRLYVAFPDRLARRYAYQVLLLEELAQAGVEVVFLNRAVGASPEDELLLQVQGIVAEYERALLTERSRRGKRHAARTGAISVRPKAPYGYRYVGKQESGGAPRYEVVPAEADVVRQMFHWVAVERWTIGAIVRQLHQEGVRTATGKAQWSRSALCTILRNPTYVGRAVYGRTRSGPWQPPLRPRRGRGPFPRVPMTPLLVPPTDWVTIPVPTMIDEATFAAVQERLDENRRRVRQHLGPAGSKRLLAGVLVCARCGYSYYFSYCRETRRQTVREYHYYRCRGTDACQYGGVARCTNRTVAAEALEEAVWAQVCALLAQPERLAAEYHRRLADHEARPGRAVAAVCSAQERARQGVARLIDSYAEGLITKEEFTPRVERLRRRLAALDEQRAQQELDAVSADDLRRALGRLEEFARRVRVGLDDADQATKREIILALVKRIEVDVDAVRVVFKVPPHPGGPNGQILRDCTRGANQVPFEGAHGFAFGLALVHAPGDIGLGVWPDPRLGQRDPIEDGVQAPVAAPIDAVAHPSGRGDLQRRDAGIEGEVGIRREALTRSQDRGEQAGRQRIDPLESRER